VGEPRELDELAGDRIDNTGLALSFERRAWHLIRMWRATDAVAMCAFSRACAASVFSRRGLAGDSMIPGIVAFLAEMPGFHPSYRLGVHAQQIC
jgi:hypothetical protein